MDNLESKVFRTIALAFLLVGGMVTLSVASSSRPHVEESKKDRVAILTTPDNGSETFLHIAEVGQPLPLPVASFQHLPNAAIKGVVMQDGSVLVVADYKPGRSRAFGSALFRLTQGSTEAKLLCDQVDYASKPLVTPTGRVFVSRGEPGPELDGKVRVDSLSIAEINPQTGEIKTLRRSTGYINYLAGSFGSKIVVYEVKPGLARLLAIDIDMGAEIMLMSSMPGFARDFSVTGNGYLVFENRDSERRDLWIAERINLVSGKVERIKEATSPLGPYGWSDGKITWSNLPENTKSRLGTTPMKLVDIQAVSSDNETALAYIVQKSSDSYVALVNSKGEELVATHLPPHTSFSVAGFMP